MPRDAFSRTRGVEPVRELVRRVISAHRLTADLREQSLFASWARYVGDRVAARTRPVTIVDRTLVVEVASSPWLHELRLIRPKIVSDLLDELGAPRFFDDIRFVLAGDRRTPGAPPSSTAVRRERVALRPRSPAGPAGPAASAQILRESAAVADPELAALIAKLRIAHDK